MGEESSKGTPPGQARIDPELPDSMHAASLAVSVQPTAA